VLEYSLPAKHFVLEHPYRLQFRTGMSLLTAYFVLECPYWLNIIWPGGKSKKEGRKGKREGVNE
jgi:hypothetical protein